MKDFPTDQPTIEELRNLRIGDLLVRHKPAKRFEDTETWLITSLKKYESNETYRMILRDMEIEDWSGVGFSGDDASEGGLTIYTMATPEGANTKRLWVPNDDEFEVLIESPKFPGYSKFELLPPIVWSYIRGPGHDV
jgi:hypothetical protein